MKIISFIIASIITLIGAYYAVVDSLILAYIRANECASVTCIFWQIARSVIVIMLAMVVTVAAWLWCFKVSGLEIE